VSFATRLNPTTEVNRFSAVLGTWFRKGSSLQGNFNAQFGGADNWIYRTDPTTFFNITGNGSYAPRPWLMLGGNFMFQQGQNNNSDINYKQHNYVSMVNATITPGEHWGLDLAYNFNAIQQNSILCFTGAGIPSGSIPCVGDNTLMQTNGVYQTHTQYGYFALTLTPVERVTIRLTRIPSLAPPPHAIFTLTTPLLRFAMPSDGGDTRVLA
jgi:hypothetical protein